MTTRTVDPEVSTFQNRPAYHYIRTSDKLPTLDEIRQLGDSALVAKVKLFNPTGAGTWYLVAYDPDDRIAYGVADIFERELGDIDIAELVAFRGRFGLPIERDLHWHPAPVSQLLA
jgi:hypothetical protein